MSDPVSKAEKKRRILAVLEGGAPPKGNPGPAATVDAKTPSDIVGMLDKSPKATSKVISEFVDENPDRTLAVFRNWMAE